MVFMATSKAAKWLTFLFTFIMAFSFILHSTAVNGVGVLLGVTAVVLRFALETRTSQLEAAIEALEEMGYTVEIVD